LDNWIICSSKVLKTNPVTYKIEGYDKEEVSGSFYELELVSYNKKDEVYEAEKNLKERTRNKKNILSILYIFRAILKVWIVG
jgi:hypothetical protein